MSGNNLLVDTNIVLYLLNGEQTLVPLLEKKQLYISFISQLELLSHKEILKEEQDKISDFLSECIIVDINASIKHYTINLCQKYGLKLPDSIIMATSMYLNIPVITADREFNKVEEIDLFYYEKDN